ncbi:Hypothetical protein F387_00930 [Wohlfahrtiimonas chitiniclastica SH04]|uniref:Glutamine-dependent NAD(+) synthetase n=1 Tax=Wohlfahrtiimonas chitiniclastica SH04 TaxID=1261130 RepID=L8XYE7_9GAMM|nr:nitrilase-related carbon-nitrogen hydrolase [Wohlfahrtiimonas chitiniclastica]ELV09038.1 Hypothetical protein F387_00930 [Wohlfahrtiimonas chitiniclastica SH04]
MYNLQIAIEQINSRGGDVARNRQIIIERIERAVSEGAELIVFPELSLSGYGADDFFLKTQFLKTCHDALIDIAKYVPAHVIALVGYPERGAAGVYSSVGILSGGQIIGNHRKTVIPNLELYMEHRYFTAGTDKTVIEIRGIKIGVIISEELFHEERLPECDVLCCSAAFLWSHELSLSRAVYLCHLANTRSMPIVYVNHVGVSNSLLLEGCSALINAEGINLLTLRHFDEDQRVTSMNQLQSANPQPEYRTTTYLKHLYWAIKFVMQEFITTTPHKKALILMDGSLNSQLILFIAMKALGKERVAGLWVQSRWDSPYLKEHIQNFMTPLGVKLYSWNLENEIIDGFISQGEQLLDERWKMGTYDRFKSTIFISVAELLGAWPVSSIDKTQIALGIKDNIASFALTGFMPLTDVYQSQLVELAELLNASNERAIFPVSLIERAKNATLQKHFVNHGRETKISEIDDILRAYMEGNQSVKEIMAHASNPELVATLIRRLHHEELNRVQAGFSPKLSNRSFQNDWLFPTVVDWGSIDIETL